MPLFKSHPEANTTRQTSPTPTRKSSIFSSKRRSPSPPAATHTNGTSLTQGFFGRHNSYSSSEDSSSVRRRNGSIRSGGSGGGGGFFGMGNGRWNDIDRDPSIVSARQKVTDAEEAEKEADRALMQARGMVKEAREHVKILELEAVEDARRAKAKQAQAKIVSKSASGLGRHG